MPNSWALAPLHGHTAPWPYTSTPEPAEPFPGPADPSPRVSPPCQLSGVWSEAADSSSRLDPSLPGPGERARTAGPAITGTPSLQGLPEEGGRPGPQPSLAALDSPGRAEPWGRTQALRVPGSHPVSSHRSWSAASPRSCRTQCTAKTLNREAPGLQQEARG